MEYFDFEGKTEAEAIELAAAELGLEPEQFEVELLNSAGRGIFRRGKVRIRVYPLVTPQEKPCEAQLGQEEQQRVLALMQKFFGGIADIIGIDCQLKLQRVHDQLMEIELISEQTGYLIGHHGKHLEALQVLVAAYLPNQFRNEKFSARVVLDAEGYRARREKQLRRLARSVAQKVVRSQGSELLEPMAAFERRIIHSTLSETPHISTASEGEGERRQIRIIYRG